MTESAEPATGREIRSLRDALYSRALPPLAVQVVRALRASWGLRVHQRETIEAFAREDRRFIFAFWHAHILPAIYSPVRPEIVVMISRHRDGELIAKTVERFGMRTARGSTTEGGSAAYREMLRAVRAGCDLAFTPDGPRGPARKVQPGVIAAARALAIPIVPFAAGADRAWTLDSWDRFLVPKPRARVLIAYGEPTSVPREESIESGTARLERAMVALEEFAAAHAGKRSVGTRI